MQKPATWRELLAIIIQNPLQKQRLADELDVHPLTLTRWINDETVPRPRNLRRLLEVVPEQRNLLLELLEAEFGTEFAQDSVSKGSLNHRFSPEITGPFYTRVLRTLATIPVALSFSSLCDLILEQALKQLDAQRSGMAIIVSRCLPPADGRIVRSLLETVGRGTPPWALRLEHEAVLLGIESLTGYAVAVRHQVVRQRLGEEGSSLLPGYRDRWEESAVATPITRQGNIGGCLLVSSAHPDYFSLAHQQLIQSYADLIALILDASAFFEPEHVHLGLLPTRTMQYTYLTEFQHRLIETMTQAARNQQPLTIVQARQLVWLQLEEKLLNLSMNNKPESDNHNSH